MNIKEIVKNNTVKFQKYRQGHMFYVVTVPGEEGELSFPVPLEDVGDATLETEDKAITFMRYIRKDIEDETFIKAN